jgi:hypothetical protein
MDRPILFWRMTWLLAFLASIMSWSVPAYGGSRAVDQDGNIFVVRSDGSRLQITSSGVDSQPDLASDGTKVVFVRKANTDASEIWIASVETRASARVLVKSPLEINGRKFYQVFTPKFSADGASVYFLIPYAATTQAIVKVHITRPEPQFIAAALNFQVVPAGQYRGDLIAQIRKAKLAPGYYEWFWLLTPEGKEIGLVGQDDGDVALFMEQQE